MTIGSTGCFQRHKGLARRACALNLGSAFPVAIVKIEMWGVNVSRIFSFGFMIAVWTLQFCSSKAQEASDDSKFKLEGKVTVPFTSSQDWIATTRILLDGGQFLGFLK